MGKSVESHLQIVGLRRRLPNLSRDALDLSPVLFLLLHGFVKDVDDPERVGIPESHVLFYYSKYFRKQLNPKAFGVAGLSAFGDTLIKDTCEWNAQKELISPLSVDTTFDVFVKVTEEQRRLRQRRIDAGDESARLKFERSAMQGAGGWEDAVQLRPQEPPFAEGDGQDQLDYLFGVVDESPRVEVLHEAHPINSTDGVGNALAWEIGSLSCAQVMPGRGRLAAVWLPMAGSVASIRRTRPQTVTRCQQALTTRTGLFDAVCHQQT